MIGKRILAFIVDYFTLIIFFIIMSFIPVNDIDFKMLLVYSLFLCLGITFLYTKDVFGRSLGKKIMGIKIVRVDGKKPSIGRLLLRNITISIWPVEAIIVLLGYEKLGDRLAKTRLIINQGEERGTVLLSWQMEHKGTVLLCWQLN